MYGSDTSSAVSLATTGIALSTLGHVVAAADRVIAGAAVVTIVRVLRARSRNHNP